MIKRRITNINMLNEVIIHRTEQNRYMFFYTNFSKIEICMKYFIFIIFKFKKYRLFSSLEIAHFIGMLFFQYYTIQILCYFIIVVFFFKWFITILKFFDIFKFNLSEWFDH